MNRPSLEMADLVGSAGRNFIERNRSWLNRLHLKVLTAIERCRTAALGGHLDECARCGHRVISFNSCRNRHCPKCQANARDRWLTARQSELLPTRCETRKNASQMSAMPHGWDLIGRTRSTYGYCNGQTRGSGRGDGCSRHQRPWRTG